MDRDLRLFEFDYASKAIELSVSLLSAETVQNRGRGKSARKCLPLTAGRTGSCSKKACENISTGWTLRKLKSNSRLTKAFMRRSFDRQQLAGNGAKANERRLFQPAAASFENHEAQLNALLFALPSGEMTFIAGWKEAAGEGSVHGIRAQIARITEELQYPDFPFPCWRFGRRQIWLNFKSYFPRAGKRQAFAS